MELDVGQPVVLPPGEGPKVLRDEVTVSILGRSSATPHVHRQHADAFYVLEGEIEFADTPLPAGGFGLAPPNVVHWFTNEGARILNIHAPGQWWKHRFDGTTDGEIIDSWDPPDDASSGALLVLPDEGERLEGPNHTMLVKAALPQLCVFEGDLGPGWNGPPAHVHRLHVDSVYVLEGALEIQIGDEPHVVEEGGFAAAPPGVVHTFRNAGDGRARFLNLHAPGVRFDEYLRRQHAGEHGGPEFHEAFDTYEVG